MHIIRMKNLFHKPLGSNVSSNLLYGWLYLKRQKELGINLNIKGKSVRIKQLSIADGNKKKIKACIL